MTTPNSPVAELIDLFERGILARHIAEPFAALDETTKAHEARDFMEMRDYDVLGVQKQGVVLGLVHREKLQKGPLQQYAQPIRPEALLDAETPLGAALLKLEVMPRIFLKDQSGVGLLILTRADLQKIPVRVLLFGMISLLEMQFLRLIRARYQPGQWEGILGSERIKAAEARREEHQAKHEALSLDGCLTPQDKDVLVLQLDDVTELLDLPTKGKVGELLKQTNDVRDLLAHAQDLSAHRDLDLFAFVRQLRKTLLKLGALSL